MLDASQIVTLTGEGGVGKTRLAAQFGRAHASRFPGGAWFCNVSSATTDDEIIERVAAAIGLRAASTQELRRDVADWLKFSQALLIVDNCEHVAGRIPTVLGLALEDIGSTKLLFTSRRALNVYGEHVMPRPSPPPSRRMTRSHRPRIPGSLFLSSEPGRPGLRWTRETRPLSQIADRVDGLPLAIELAARRLTAMTPPELLLRLNRSFDLLTAPEEQPHHRQALRATLDWSFGLLDPTSRRMLAALSVCEGGFGLELAEAVGGAIGLSDSEVARAVADLWDQSLLSTEGSVPGRARYRMLALIRDYSSKQLDLDGNRPPAAHAHAEYFVNVTARLGTRPYGPQELEAVVAIETEFDNIRQAFGWCVAEERWDHAREMLDSLVPELVLRDRIEIGRWAAETLAALGGTQHPVRSVAAALAANMALVEGRFTDAESLGLQSLESENRAGRAPHVVVPQCRRAPACRKRAFRGGRGASR